MAGSTDGCAYMWTVATGTMMGVFAGHSGSVTCGQFTPDGKKVVTGAEDGTTRIWNPKDQQTLTTFSGHLWHSLVLFLFFVDSNCIIFILLI
jgi:angio-associated migratory cell protein